MLKKSFFLDKKYIIISLSIILLSSILSFFFNQYVYDGHHHGLMFSNALDLINLKKPYKEIFIQYGLLTTIIHAMSLYIFGKFIFSLHIITIIFYLSSIFVIFKIIEKIVNVKYAVLGIFALVSNHPFPVLPWSNYIAFFFITISIFFFLKKNNYSLLLAGFCLGLCVLSRQDYFIAIFTTLTTYMFVCFFFERSINKFKNIIKLLSGFLIPLSFFFLYLVYFDLFDKWIKYLLLPTFYLEYSNVSISEYIINFIKFFLSKSFINYINEPQYLLISLILISNSFLSIIFLVQKKFNLFFVAVLSLFLSSVGISTELFRLYTSVSIGIVSLMYFISRIKSDDLKNLCIFLILITSFFSFLFYPTGNYISFNKINIFQQNQKPSSELFKFKKWLPHQVDALNQISRIRNDLLFNCKIKFGENLTFNTYFTNILNLERVKIIPYVKSDSKNSLMHKYFDNGFVSKINQLIIEENIILIISENNDSFDEGNIKFNDNYKFEIVNLNKINQKPFVAKFYYPKKCYSKS